MVGAAAAAARAEEVAPEKLHDLRQPLCAEREHGDRHALARRLRRVAHGRVDEDDRDPREQRELLRAQADAAVRRRDALQPRREVANCTLQHTGAGHHDEKLRSPTVVHDASPKFALTESVERRHEHKAEDEEPVPPAQRVRADAQQPPTKNGRRALARKAQAEQRVLVQDELEDVDFLLLALTI